MFIVFQEGETYGVNVGVGSHSIEFAMRLVQMMISKLSLGTINNEYSSELAMMVSLNVTRHLVYPFNV